MTVVESFTASLKDLGLTKEQNPNFYSGKYPTNL